MRAPTACQVSNARNITVSPMRPEQKARTRCNNLASNPALSEGNLDPFVTIITSALVNTRVLVVSSPAPSKLSDCVDPISTSYPDPEPSPDPYPNPHLNPNASPYRSNLNKTVVLCRSRRSPRSA